MQNIKIKIITGFRKDQEYTIDADEAHIAYKLFLDPEQRAIFRSGLALTGKDIRAIEPDYHATMGWNQTYQLTSDDWNEIHRMGVDRKIRDCLNEAKTIAVNDDKMAIEGFQERYKMLE